MTNEKQAELIAIACKESGLDGHIKWIERSSDAHTYAERIANGIRLGNVKRLQPKIVCYAPVIARIRGAVI